MQKHPVQSLRLIGWGAKIPPTPTQVNRFCKTASQGTRQRKAGRSWAPRFRQSATCTLGAGTWVGLIGWGLSRRRNMAMISSPYGEGISYLTHSWSTQLWRRHLQSGPLPCQGQDFAFCPQTPNQVQLQVTTVCGQTQCLLAFLNTYAIL